MELLTRAAYAKPRKREYFADLPEDEKRDAEKWLLRFRRRWEGNLPNWRLAILVGRARRLALQRPDSAWGRSMLAARGGYAVQKLLRARKIGGVNASNRPGVAASGTWNGLAASQRIRKNRNVDWAPIEIPPDPNRPAIKTAPPSPAAHRMHKFFDPPGCKCYYCAWPYHET